MSSMFCLKDRVAIVSGSGRGIGREMAFGLAEAGANLVLVSRTKEQLEETKADINAKFPNVKIMVNPADVSKSGEAVRVVKETTDEFGRLDILLNNAGVNYKKDFLDFTEEDFRNIIDLNLTSQFMFAHAAATYMAKHGGGKIVNTASVGAVQAIGRAAPYCASKGGVLMLTKVMALDLAPYKINVNAICPGYIDTGLLVGDQKTAAMQAVQKATATASAGEKTDLNGAIVYLCSDASRYVTGTQIFVDGGMSMIAMR